LLGIFVVLMLVIGLVGLAAAETPPGGTFSDDDGNIHEGYIEAIAVEGITRGCNPPVNDLYCPSTSVTRGQMATFLVRALDLTDQLDDPFTDDDDSVFEAEIEKLAAAGITMGCNPPVNDMFCPDADVTRGQMAAFLVRALAYTAGGGEDLFTDDDDSVFEADIDRLRTAGVTMGCNPPDNTRFCPNDPVLRDQMASFLARALGLAAIDVPSPTATTTTSTTAPDLDYPQSGDYWYLDGCENDTGTCTYTAGAEDPVSLVVESPLLPRRCTLWDITGCRNWVSAWDFLWIAPSGDQVSWNGRALIDGYQFFMSLSGRTPGMYQGMVCPDTSPQPCPAPLLWVHFYVR
jgi:hypothetical protein